MNAANLPPGQAVKPSMTPQEKAAWDKYFDYLIKTLREPDATARLQAARILGENREPRAVGALGAALADPDASVRQNAAEALGRIGEPAVEPLIHALADPDTDVRQLAAKALGQIDDSRTVAPLIACLRDPFDGVRSQAAFALCRLGSAAVDALVAALRHADPNLRLQASRILGQIGDPRALPELERVAREDRSAGRGTGMLTANVAEVARQAAEKVRGRKT